MADKCKCECKEGAPEWLGTYGDMVTLLLCFFVLLFAFSNISSNKFMKLIASFKGAYGVFSGTSVAPPGAGAFRKRRKAETKKDVGKMMEEDVKLTHSKNKPKKVADNKSGYGIKSIQSLKQQQVKQSKFNKLLSVKQTLQQLKADIGNVKSKIQKDKSNLDQGKELTQSEIIGLKKFLQKQMEETKEMLKAMIEKLNIKVPQEVEVKEIEYGRSQERGILIRIKNKVLYDSGSYILKPEALKVLKKIGEIIKKIPCTIRVEGHTDNVPISPALRKKIPSNWELSVMRAVNVVKFFIKEVKIDPRRLSAAGFGPYHPIASNKTPEGRAKNRRVDIYLIFPKNYLKTQGGIK